MSYINFPIYNWFNTLSFSCNQPEQHEIKILLKFTNKDLHMNLQFTKNNFAR